MKTLQQLAQESLDIQNACNSCGLALRFAAVMKELMAHSREHKGGTDWVNQHPITKMWISKFEHLATLEQSMSVGDVDEVHDLAEGKPPTPVRIQLELT